MNQHLMQAIAAARAGKEPQAKVLLARVIKDEPENVNAWFLLSSLADTEEQKIQHLQKVLELDPNHQAATEQMALLAPEKLEPVEAAVEETVDALEAAAEEPVEAPEAEEEPEPDMFPLPDVDLESPDVPEDTEEAMAWLEQLAADQGAPLEELPSVTEETETAEPEIAPPIIDYAEPETVTDSDVSESEVPEDPEEAMAWLDQIAAEQDTSLEEVPTMIEAQEPGELEEEVTEEGESLETAPTMIEEQVTEEGAVEEPAEGEPAKPMAVSDDYDFLSQAEGDTIPAWLEGEEDYIGAETVISESPVEETAEQPEPETLPDWLHEESIADWEGEEGEKSGQVVWKAGEGDESKVPTPPTAESAAGKEAKPAAAQTAAGGNNTSLFLAALIFIAIVLVVAILYILIYQPL